MFKGYLVIFLGFGVYFGHFFKVSGMYLCFLGIGCVLDIFCVYKGILVIFSIYGGIFVVFK